MIKDNAPLGSNEHTVTAAVDRRQAIVGAASLLIGTRLVGGSWSTSAFASTTLPSTPLAAGAKIAFLGDSYVQRGAYSRREHGELQGYAALARGAMNLLAGMDTRFRIEIFATDDHPYNGPDGDNELTGSMHGLGGDRVWFERKDRPGYLIRLQYCLDRNPDIIVIDSAGANNVGDGDPPEEIVQHLDELLSAIGNAGVHAVMFTLPTMEAWDERKRANAGIVNDWMVSQAEIGRAGFHLADTRAIEVGEAIAAGHFSDGAHRSPSGTYTVVSTVLLPLMQGLVAEGTVIDPDPLSDNVFPVPGIPGTGGSWSVKDGSPEDISGAVATGMHVHRPVGRSKVACSKEEIRPGVEWQVFTIDPVPDDAEEHEIRFVMEHNGGTNLSEIGIDPSNDWGMEFLLPVVLNDWQGWLMPAAPGGGPVSLRAELYSSNPNAFRSQAINAATFGGGSFTLRALAQFYRSGALPDHIRWGRPHRAVRIIFNPRIAGTGIVKIGSPIWRRLTASPAADWNL